MSPSRTHAPSGQVLLLLVITLLAQQAAAQDGDSSTGEEASADAPLASRSLRLETVFAAGTVSVNGIPVLRHTTPGGSEGSGASLNPFLKQGTNRIDIQLEAPEQADFPSIKPRFQLTVRAEDQMLIELKQSAPEITFPYTKTLSLELKSFPTLPLWKAAAPPPLEQSKKEITAALNALSKQMQAALKKKDRKAVLAVFGPLMEGNQILREGTLANVDIMDVYETLDSLAEEEVPPATMKVEQLTFALLPGTNLYLVEGTERRAAVGFRFTNGQDRGAYRVLMGKVDGKWQILGQLRR
jgi:hypothetical protein